LRRRLGFPPFYRTEKFFLFFIVIGAHARRPSLPSNFEIYVFISGRYVFGFFSPSHPKKGKLLADKSPPTGGVKR